MTAALILLMLVVQGIHMPSGKTMIIGLYCEQDGSMERTLCEDLENSHSRFAFVNYQDKEQMYKEVQSGKLECGFLMQSDFTERVRQDNWKKCVTYIANPFTTKGEVAKETFFAAFFKEYSGKLLAQSEKEIFTTQDQKRLEKMQKSSESAKEKNVRWWKWKYAWVKTFSEQTLQLPSVKSLNIRLWWGEMCFMAVPLLM